ncbi:MAG: hypothetical protein IJ626_04425, partial [Muribaculaceae bacterium]|nr:hypothetical protein [Muribaculaceae bacterium]
MNFRTSKQLEPKQILDAIACRGERIVVTSDKFPSLRFGAVYVSLRGIEINREDNGYEVRVCSFANRSDLKLYSSVVEVMLELTNAQCLYEDDEEQPITNPKDFFDAKWIDEQIESSLITTSGLIRYSGKPIIMDGMFFPFCVGPRMAKSYNLHLKEPCMGDMERIQYYLTAIQWGYSDKESTSSRLVMPNPDDESERPLSLSIIYAEGGKVKPFDFVSYADVVCLMNLDKDEEKPVFIKMEDFWKIVPEKGFSLMDEYQLLCDKPLKYKAFKQMCEDAKLFHVDDLHQRFTYPGNGYNEKQKTYVLMWNPAISSITLDAHNENIPEIMTEYFNWSVYEYQEAKKGDRFVMVRCGTGKTGLVMSGIFDSNPYQSGDWSGRGRTVYYMDLEP